MRRMSRKLTRGVVLLMAWLFIVSSVALLLSTAVTGVWSNGTDSTYLFFEVVVDQQSYGGLGLSYHGWTGVLLAIIEAVAITACLVFSCRRNVVLRRLGHVGLVAWGFVPPCNALCLYYTYGYSVMLFSAASMAVFWVCVSLRAVWGWTPRGGVADVSPRGEVTSIAM